MLNLMMSKNNHPLNNNISNSFFSTAENNTSTTCPQQHQQQEPITVDKSIWDMYQLLMQNATSQPTACQQQNETITNPLDQILLAAATSKLSPPQQQPSPILVVINNSHNTSLNHHSNTTPPIINQIVNTLPMDNQQYMSNDNIMYNFQHQQHAQQHQYQYNHKNLDSTLMNTSKLRGIQKSHKMNKQLTPHHAQQQHISSPIHHSPTTSEIYSSSASSSNCTPTNISSTFGNSTTAAANIKSESNNSGKFSRPLLKNETVLCEKNPKFKQNYFVFEKKKEKTPISFHNISVNEIISGEIPSTHHPMSGGLSAGGLGGSNNSSSPLNNKLVSSAGQKRKKSNRNEQQQQPIHSSGFVQYPIQTFQQHIPSNPSIQSSLDSSSHSNQSSPKSIIMMQNQTTTTTNNQQQPSNIRMTHSPNTHSPNTINSIHHQQQQQQPEQIQSNVLNILLSSNTSGGSEYTPINSFALGMNNSHHHPSMVNVEETSTVVDELLANLPPVVDSLFQQQPTATATITEEAFQQSSFDDFIREEDLSTLYAQTSTHDIATTNTTDNLLQEWNPEQLNDLLREYIMLTNNNNNNNSTNQK